MWLRFGMGRGDSVPGTPILQGGLLRTAVAGHAEGPTPVTTPDNQGGATKQQDMNRSNGSSTMQGGPAAAGPRTTTGLGMAKNPTNTTACDPQKKSMDDPKQYGSPDRH